MWGWLIKAYVETYVENYGRELQRQSAISIHKAVGTDSKQHIAKCQNPEEYPIQKLVRKNLW